MHSETEDERTWRSEFEAMSPTQRLTAVAPNPHDFAPPPKIVYWQALLAKQAATTREAHDEETRAIAKDANRLASEANEIARSQTKAAWRAARWAMYAALVAAAAAIAANKEQILALFFGQAR